MALQKDGTISVNGEEISQLADADLTRYRRDQVGIIFQFFNLIGMTISSSFILFVIYQRVLSLIVTFIVNIMIGTVIKNLIVCN